MTGQSESIALYGGAGLRAWQTRCMTPADAQACVRALADELTLRFPRARTIAVVEGPAPARPADLWEAAFRARGRTAVVGGVRDLAGAMGTADVVVDAWYAGGGTACAPETVEALAHRAGPIVALGVPACVDPDRGTVAAMSYRAAVTYLEAVTALGVWTGAARECCGSFQRIGGVQDVDVSPRAWIPGMDSLRHRLPRRPQHAHKGTAGTVLIVGGDEGMPGAVRLAAAAAYRTGAGLVGAIVHPRNAPGLAAAYPELIAPMPAQVAPLWARADVAVVGSGLGRGDFARAQWAAWNEHAIATVIDGDGLYWLAQERGVAADIVTPHEGEAARLLGCTVGEIGADRPAAARAIARDYDSICVLKGAGTLIDDGMQTWVCPFGNPAMATAGMGDVLAGIIGALLGQGADERSAAILGVFVHSCAGDAASARIGARGIVARDVIEEIPACLSVYL
ncbi:MAG: NAD(P)H-hydrate dehydratase [Gammaproteobacteria bacterium]|nr:NAD(P)H-hydrate dehydratase [Gammaproteobacteria bacterium]